MLKGHSAECGFREMRRGTFCHSPSQLLIFSSIAGLLLRVLDCLELALPLPEIARLLELRDPLVSVA